MPGVALMPVHLIGLVVAGGLTAFLHLKPVFSLQQLRLLESGVIFSAAIIAGALQFTILSEIADLNRPGISGDSIS